MNKNTHKNQSDRVGVDDDSSVSKKNAKQPKPSQVAAFLKDNPDFFVDNDQILNDLMIPHASGGAVSLLERQVAVLRDCNLEMRTKLFSLLDTVRDNNQLFEKTKKLTLNLFNVNQLDDIADIVMQSMVDDFKADLISLVVFDDPANHPGSSARIVMQEDAQEHIASILREKPTLGRSLRSDELDFLFPNDVNNVGSVAVAPLGQGGSLGVLAIGSKDPDYFQSNMDTLFLSYVTEALCRVLVKFVQNDGMPAKKMMSNR